MGLKEKFNLDLKTAMKSGDALKTGVLRLLNAAIHNKEIEVKAKGVELSEDQTMQILGTEAKKRKEAIEIYEQGGRKDLAEKERAELGVIQAYLPMQLGQAEVEAAVKSIVHRDGLKDFGQAMKAVMKDLRGKADSRVVSDAVNKFLKP